MQNNSLFKEMNDEIQKSHYIVLIINNTSTLGTISSILALSNYFYENRIKHKVVDKSLCLPRKLNFLPKFDKISKDIPKYYDLVIDLCGESQSEIEELFENKKSISINNKKLNNNSCINIVDEQMNSSSELLYDFFITNKLLVSKNTIECLYSGIYCDSLGFTTSKSSVKTFQIISSLLENNIDTSNITDNLLKRESLATFKVMPKIMNTLELFNEGQLASVYLEEQWLKETGADINECDDIVNRVLAIGIVKIVVYFRIIKDEVIVLLKSKGNLDLPLVSGGFNGKIDNNSARLSINSSSIVDVKEKIIKFILNYI